MKRSPQQEQAQQDNKNNKMRSDMRSVLDRKNDSVCHGL